MLGSNPNIQLTYMSFIFMFCVDTLWDWISILMYVIIWDGNNYFGYTFWSQLPAKMYSLIDILNAAQSVFIIFKILAWEL